MSTCALPEPGTEYGPCVGVCQHIDCAETRKQAETLCDLCSEPIGYGRQFFQRDAWTVLTHARCMFRKLDQEKRANAPA
jgi:hypothetical protein